MMNGHPENNFILNYKNKLTFNNILEALQMHWPKYK